MLTRRGSDLGTLTVQAVAAPGTADASDFVAGVTNITWANGDSASKFLVIPLLDDGLVKSNRTILVSLTNPSVPGAIGLTNSAQVTIIDNDAYGTIEFSRSSYETEENGTNVVITVVRNNGIAGTVSVDLTVSNITATAGADYTTNLVPKRLTFAPGERTKTFAIGVINDSLSEDLETLGVALFNPSLATIGFVSNAVVSIIDDENLNTPAGSPDTTFDIAVGPDAAVYNLGLQRDGKIVIGGAFTTVDHVVREHMARLLPDGALDPNYNASENSGVNRDIRTIAVQNDGKTLIGGLFTSVQGTNFNYVARLNSDGTVDIFFNPGSGADNPIFALALLPSGQVVVGGSFVTFNGAARPGVSALNTRSE